MTPQEQMQAKLRQCGIPAVEIKCYGSQIMITTLSETAARKWASVLVKFAKVRLGQSVDYNQRNEGTNLCPTMHKVWRVWGTI